VFTPAARVTDWLLLDEVVKNPKLLTWYWYEVIVAPPLEAGGDHVNVFDPAFPVERARLCGAPGTVVALTTAAVFEETAEVEPLAFVAVTRQRIGL
jgi:hypothetical protein